MLIVLLSFEKGFVFALSTTDIPNNGTHNGTEFDNNSDTLKLYANETNISETPNEISKKIFAYDFDFDDEGTMVLTVDSSLGAVYYGVGGWDTGKVVVVDTKQNNDPSDDEIVGEYSNTTFPSFPGFQGYGNFISYLPESDVIISGDYLFIQSYTNRTGSGGYYEYYGFKRNGTVDPSDDTFLGSTNTGLASSQRTMNFSSTGNFLETYATTGGFKLYNTQGTDSLSDDTLVTNSACYAALCVNSPYSSLYDSSNDIQYLGGRIGPTYYGGVVALDRNNTIARTDDVVLKTYRVTGYETTAFDVWDFNIDYTNGLLYFGTDYGLMVYDTLDNTDPTDDTPIGLYNSSSTPAISQNQVKSFGSFTDGNRIVINNQVFDTKGTNSISDDELLWTLDGNYLMSELNVDSDPTSINFYFSYVDSVNGLLYAKILGIHQTRQLVQSLIGYLPTSSYYFHPSQLAGYEWATGANLTEARIAPVFGVINDKLYVAAGTKDFVDIVTGEVYDPELDTWSSIASMPGAVVGAGSTVVGGKLYSFGGRDGVYQSINSVYSYDPNTDSWETLASLPIAVIGPAVTAVGNSVYVFGGSNSGSDSLVSTQIYDTVSDTWSVGPDMPLGRSSGHFAQHVDGKIYISAGSNDAGAGPFLRTVDILDLNTNTWSSGTEMPEATTGSATFVYDHLIFVLGGSDNDTNSTQHSFVYNTLLDKWYRLKDFSAGKHRSAVGVADGKLIVAGGKDVNWNSANAVVFADFQAVLDSLTDLNYVSLSWSDTKPSGTNISMYYSLDGGNNFSLANSNPKTIQTLGTGLFYKASFTTTNPEVTATLNSITTTYSKNNLSGSYRSEVIDSLKKSSWNSITVNKSTPAGTSVTAMFRTGDTSVPDSSWSEWQSLGEISSSDSRYLQYKLTLTSNSVNTTPEISSVNINYTNIENSTPVISNPTDSNNEKEEEEKSNTEKEEELIIDEPTNENEEKITYTYTLYDRKQRLLKNTKVLIDGVEYTSDELGRLTLGFEVNKESKIEVYFGNSWNSAVLGANFKINAEVDSLGSKYSVWKYLGIVGIVIVIIIAVITILKRLLNSSEI